MQKITWSKLSFWLKIIVILSVAQLVATVIFFSAWDKSRVKWDNSRNSTQKMRTLDSYASRYTFFGYKRGMQLQSSFSISKYTGPKIAHHSNISSSLYETWSVKVNKNEDIGLTKIATKLLSEFLPYSRYTNSNSLYLFIHLSLSI